MGEAMETDQIGRRADVSRSAAIVHRPSSIVRRPRKRTFRLTRAGWALLPASFLLTLGAINSGLNVTYLLACLMITVFFIGIIVPLWNGRGVDCRREILEPPYAGEPFEYTLVVTSRRRSAARLVRIRDPLGGPQSERKLIARIPPKGTIRIPCIGAPLRRGAHPMPVLDWRSGFPFGLAECGARLRASGPSTVAQGRPEYDRMGGELLVYPARGTLARALASPGKPVAARAGVTSVTGHLAEDFRSLREYHPGDSLRRVHWRSSAHRGQLHVRELERERFAPTLILLDSRLPIGLSAEKEPGALSERERAEEALELAVSFAAEVARSAMRQGNNVTIVGHFPQPALLVANERDYLRFESDESFATKDTKGAKNGEEKTSQAIAAVPGDPRVLKVESGHGRSFERLMEALARLTPSNAATADALPPLAARAGLTSGGRVVGVSPTTATAQSLRDAFAGRPAEIYAASDEAFADVFRLLTKRNGV
jgi:uncharacterized protein (DUF58 family)